MTPVCHRHVKEVDAGLRHPNKSQKYAAIGKAADMVCESHTTGIGANGPAGPIAPKTGSTGIERLSHPQIPANKVLLGVGPFG